MIPQSAGGSKELAVIFTSYFWNLSF